ncbi:hypothetical protein L1987_39521 [Smallanthus sonchifolius]|uniref:Uncharacterized protein n=1 Tax=Smallanthus sonchifolius TaxID=185202 RepID=A0ACB9HP00_9ASTR|nr:hypothetical protein L1987_39521 [Smallanthus sonchifolius]
MATRFLSEYGLRPLPKFYHTPRTKIPTVIIKGLPAKISSTQSVHTVDEDEKRVNGLKLGDNGFNPGAPPPFTLADIRAAIPKHCWVKDSWWSMSYVLIDVVVVFGLAAVTAYFNSMVVWPLYWFAQGTMFWALFVLGHDCGHGSFSNDAKLNSVVGHLLHSSILVPYHGWRISHRTHHQNHGHVENDESWHPLSEKIYRSLDAATRMLSLLVSHGCFACGFDLCDGSSSCT